MFKRIELYKLILPVLLACALLLISGSCGGTKGPPVVLAASSVLEETGILQAWMEDFRSRTGWEVEVEVVPDIDALVAARYGECDATVTHLPSEEEQIERYGYVEVRQEVMRDDYILVGPPADPAGTREAETSTEAFRKIAETQQPFVIRVDGSGTSYRTQSIWVSTGIEDFGDWFIEGEGGMKDTLRQASQEGAYTLSDRSSYQQISEELDLVILYEGEQQLENPYHVMVVSGAVYPDTNSEGALALVDYLLSEDAANFFELGAWEAPSDEDGGSQDEAEGSGG
jgi:tungstate transport system substrate-binding protein